MVKKLDIFDDYNKNDKIQIVFDSGLDTAKGSSVREEHVFGIYTNEYNAKYGGYVYLDFKGWVDSNNVIVKPSSLVITLRTTPGAYVKGGFSKVIFDETGFVTSRVKTDYFIWDPADFTLNLSSDTVFSKYWLTNKKIDADFFKKFNNTYGVKIEEFEDYVDDNISETGLDVHVSKSNGKLDVNYPGSHNLGGSGGGSGGASVTDIELKDFIIGLENQTLTNSFYNVIEASVAKTEKMKYFGSYIGSKGIFQTDNKVYLSNLHEVISIDKASDAVTIVDRKVYNTLLNSLNRFVCELNDYFVVFSYNNPGYLLLVDKTTDDVTKVDLDSSAGLNNIPLYFQTRDANTGRRFSSQLNPSLTNGDIIWAFTSFSSYSTIYCINDFLNGSIVYRGLNYLYAQGAICAPNGALYVPYKSTNSNPVSIISKWRYDGGLTNINYNIPATYSLSINLMNPIIHNNFIIYPAYDASNTTSTNFLIMDTTNDSLQYAPLDTLNTSISSQNALTMVKDELTERIYFVYTNTANTAKIGYLTLNGGFTTVISTFDFPGVYISINPAQIKRIDNDTIGVQMPQSSVSYTMNIIKDDLSEIITTDVYTTPVNPQAQNIETPDYFDADSEYIYAKPYGSRNLIKIKKDTGDVEEVELIKKGTYEQGSYYTENVVVLGDNNVLILPVCHYKDGDVYNIIDDVSLTEGKLQHSLNPTSGTLRVWDKDKLYLTNNYLLSNNMSADVYGERIRLKDSSRLAYVKDHEQIPFMD